MLINRKQRAYARRIAAQNWNRVNSDNTSLTIQARRDLAKRMTEDQIFDSRYDLNSGRGFGSVIGTLVLSLMVRIAFKLIERWMEERLFSVSESEDE